jgi:tetratricopeptide (TPR) repeat protein
MQDLSLQLSTAQTLLGRGKWREAEQIYSDILESAFQESDTTSKINILWGLSNAHNNLGSYSEAINFSLQGLELCQQSSTEVQESFLTELGTAYYWQCLYDKALDYYQQSLLASRKKNSTSGEVNSLSCIANIYLLKGDTSQAIEMYEKASRASRDLGDRQQEAIMLMNLGNACRPAANTIGLLRA